MSADTVVIGAGIGGLTTALALAAEGHRVTVVEQAARFEAVGAGIVLAPNAVQVLARLGVDLSSAGHPLRRTEIRTAAGRAVNAIDLAALTARYGPSYGITRPDLHALLAAALPASVDVVLGRRVPAVDPLPDAVAVDWGEGVRRFDLAVGADGLRSAVRGGLVGPQPLRYSGTTCWRGVVGLADGDTAPGVAVEAWGRGTRVGVVPVGPGLAYYYLVADAPAGAPSPPWHGGLRSRFAGYGGLAGRLIEALDDDPPLHHDLFELDRPVWGRSRVLLLGDAAHAMTPNQGQGAAMAIEDALALAVALRPGVDGVLERYRTARHARVRRVQLTSRRIGAMAHVGVPAVGAVRDGVMRLVPGSAATRSVRRLVAPGVDLARSA